MKKSMCLVMVICLVVSSVSVFAIDKDIKTTLTNKKISIEIGKKKSVKLKNVEKGVKWKITKGKKIISIERKGKYKNRIIIKGKKAGKAVIVAKYKKKTYRVKVVVNKKKGKKEINTKQQETTKMPEITSTEKATTPETSVAETSTEEATTEMIEHQIFAELQNNVIVQGKDLLTITYYVKEGNIGIPATYVYTSAPLMFQRYENGMWVDVPLTGEPFQSDYVWITPYEPEVVEVDLTKHYGELSEGRYRYTKRFVFNDGLYPDEWTPDEYINGDNVDGKEVTVEFDIVSDL